MRFDSLERGMRKILKAQQQGGIKTEPSAKNQTHQRTQKSCETCWMIMLRSLRYAIKDLVFFS